MFGIKTFNVSDTQRMLVMENNLPVKLLSTGEHRFYDFRGKLSFKNFSISNGMFELPDFEILWKQRHDVFAEHLEYVRAGEEQVILVLLDGRAFDIVKPNEYRALWKDRGEWEFLSYDIVEGQAIDERLKSVLVSTDSVRVREKLKSLILQVNVSEVERLFLLNEQNLQSVLSKGMHYLWNSKQNINVMQAAFSDGELECALLPLWLNEYEALLSQHLIVTKTAKQEVVLAYLDGCLVDLVAPESQACFWKQRGQWQFKTLSFEEGLAVPVDLVQELCLSENARVRDKARQLILHVEVNTNANALLFDGGELKGVLESGHFGFWKLNKKLSVKLVDKRQQNLDVSGQEILTKDRVSLRLNLSAQYSVIDAVKAVTQHADYQDFIYRTLQLMLREAVGMKTLDELLADKDALNNLVFQSAQEAVAVCGIELQQVGVRDIILPGEMKNILNQVVEAQKTAEANIIKRREETAATRSLHNTAKVMEGNATLLRLKELEVLERVSDRIDTLTVYGGLDGVMREMVTLPGASK
ncbi:slipin family protein [Pleionea sp. CnH1-48]|uniref:slipin family protein n=1 Tax=Pleionea sp. CnH1-48 TaxID=2954494 RepID=UPI002098595F|nr:slipin family protein [Pleionea sp. CnH1-48]MCO7224713.1 slipin family protein [Pleionea sp. CnH1-48]